MKTYDEMTASVLARRDAYVRRRKKQNSAIAAGSLACVIAAVCLLAGRRTPHFFPDASSAPSDAVTLSMESRLYLSSGGRDTLLEEGLTLPTAYTLSVKDIRGLPELEVEAIYEQEQEASKETFLYNDDTIAHASTLRRENTIISLYRLGTFELEIDDPTEVVAISGKSNSEYGRVEFFHSSPSIPKEDYGAFSGDEMTLSGDYYQILVQEEQDGTGRLEINWRPSPALYDAIDQNPDLPLSTFGDVFALYVEYRDGSFEEHLVDICFDDQGEAALSYHTEEIWAEQE